MSDKAVTIPLTTDGKIVDPATLLDALREAEGQDVTIDAGETPILTARHLQILVAAERRSQDIAHGFRVINRTEPFENCLTLLGWHPGA